MAVHRHRESILPVNTEASIFDVLGLNPAEWTRDALCAQTDPEAWFPEKGQSTREAKAICAHCPVQAECVDAALANEERFGVWGGLSERERRRILRRMDRPSTHNARKTYCDNGHLLDEENTYERPGGGRNCRRCQRDAVARYKQRHEEPA